MTLTEYLDVWVVMIYDGRVDGNGPCWTARMTHSAGMLSEP
jgi:hypothetical protein